MPACIGSTGLSALFSTGLITRCCGKWKDVEKFSKPPSTYLESSSLRSKALSHAPIADTMNVNRDLADRGKLLFPLHESQAKYRCRKCKQSGNCHVLFGNAQRNAVMTMEEAMGLWASCRAVVLA